MNGDLFEVIARFYTDPAVQNLALRIFLSAVEQGVTGNPNTTLGIAHAKGTYIGLRGLHKFTLLSPTPTVRAVRVPVSAADM
jgi:hypothetical protein